MLKCLCRRFGFKRLRLFFGFGACGINSVDTRLMPAFAGKCVTTRVLCKGYYKGSIKIAGTTLNPKPQTESRSKSTTLFGAGGLR